MTHDSTSSLPALDTLWNFGDPAATESKFRALLPQSRESGDAGYLAELLTQIARTQALQQRYAEADATLDDADRLITPEMKGPRVRSLLERGRVLNSSGNAERAVPVFEQAIRLAREAMLEFYAIDAAHMLGIAVKGEGSLRWNEAAISMAEAAGDPRARRWLGSLYNNIGWTYHDLGRHQDALDMFEKYLRVRTEEQNAQQMGIARWSIAKMLRFLGAVEEALRIQLELLTEPEFRGNDSEGYAHEEVAECLMALGRQDEAAPHFAAAWKFLNEDPWLQQDEPQRLERLKNRGGIT